MNYEARKAVEKAEQALKNGKPWMADAWARKASELIRESECTAQQTRRLVAPQDGPTHGDKAVLVCIILVFVWLLADTIGGLL